MVMRTEKYPGLILNRFAFTWNHLENDFITNYIFTFQGEEILLSSVGIVCNFELPQIVEQELIQFYMNSMEGICTLKRTLEFITKADKESLKGFEGIIAKGIYPECLETVSPYYTSYGLSCFFKDVYKAILPLLKNIK